MKKNFPCVVLITLFACISDDEQNLRSKSQQNDLTFPNVERRSSASANTSGSVGARISLEDFRKYKKAFAESYPKENGGLYFSRSTFERLLSVKNTAYIFAHFGVENNELHTMFAPTDQNRKSIFGFLSESTIEDKGRICKSCIPSLTELETGNSSNEEIPTPAGRRISREDFTEYKRAFQNKFPGLNESVYFSKHTFERLLGVRSMTYVYAHFMIEDGKLQVAFVPVDAQGTALLADANGESTVENYAALCPPACPTTTN
jgi:hypothetical protein